MTDSQEDVDRLILDIHAAPLEPERWQHVVQSLCQIHRADKAQLFSMPTSRGESFWHISTGVDPDANAAYATEFADEDVWLLEGQRRGTTTAGRISVGEELIDRRDFLRSRFYNEFLVPHDIDRFMNIVLRPPIAPGTPLSATLSLYRGNGNDPFGSRERETLARLAPHLILAVNTFWKARALSLHSAGLSQTLDAVMTPLFIVDAQGRLLFANDAAENVLRSDDCLRLVDGRLAPSYSVRQSRICIEALRGIPGGCASTVNLTVGPSGRMVVLSTAPLSEPAKFGPWSSAARLVWLAPILQTPNAAKRIAQLFELTRAEERLLALLSAGSSLTESAAVLRVSIHTARSHLKAIQRKSGWRTQGELARMMQQLSAIDPQFSKVSF